MEQDFYKQTVCEKHSLLLFRGKLVTKEPMVLYIDIYWNKIMQI